MLEGFLIWLAGAVIVLAIGLCFLGFTELYEQDFKPRKKGD